MDSLEQFMEKIDSIINRQLSKESPDTRELITLWELRTDINNQIHSIEKRRRFQQGYKKSTKLKDLVPEFTLVEFRLDTSVEEKIDEFGELSDQMDRIKQELTQIKNRYGQLEDELRPVLEELKDQHEQSLQTQKYLVSIKRKGYSRESYKYKESFEESLTKVNSQTRKLLEDLLKSTKTTTRVISSVGVQRLDESPILKRVIQKIKNVFRGVFRSFRKTKKEMDTLQSLSKKMVRK